MLAMKNILADGDTIDTMIFDEVDSGVSGRAATKIASKLKQLAKNKQIFCITHLPQIAAAADHHIYVEKTVEDGASTAKIRTLNFDERKNEIARIISGDNITESALKNAEDMLNFSMDTI